MFEDLLNNDEKYLLNRLISNDVIFTNDNYKLKFLRLDISDFKGNVTFKNTDLKCGIYFHKCTFYGDLKFEGVQIDDFGNILHEPYESIIFEDCKFYGEVIFSHNTTILRDLIFRSGCTFYKRITVINILVKEGSLYIEDCIFNNIIDIQRSNFSSMLSITNTKVSLIVRIVSVKSNSINFTGANDFQRGRIELCQVENGIIFNDGIFNGDWEINACGTRKQGVTLFSSQFKTSLMVNYQLNTVYSWKLGAFYIRECSFGNGMFVSGKNEELTSDKTIIDSIDIKLSTSMKGEINFQDLDVAKIKLSGVNTGCNIVFRNIDINQFEINTLTNSSGLILSYINKSNSEWLDPQDSVKKIDSLFKIYESNLGKAHFHGMNLSNFREVIVSGSLISEISVSLMEWFTIDVLNKTSLNEHEKFYRKSLQENNEKLTFHKKRYFQRAIENKKDIFRQLKIIYQKQSDNPKALYFQRNEMCLHKEILDLERNVNIGDWLIFWSNKYSNDFGQNWIKAVIGLLTMSFLCYLPIAILTSPNLDQSRFMSSCSDLMDNVSAVLSFNQLKQWFVLLNPAHRIGDLFDSSQHNISTLIYMIDFLSRIIVAYFVFQLVSAFRKYNK
ncbi:hypothetical protein GCM10009120_14580 [Sphingobacterium siyangense subsp. cladoniae]|uniref:hypothetical protein n=1 Tax=Sphingobacterium siyangense TaxID=459529 RepID=UPI0031F774D9